MIQVWFTSPSAEDARLPASTYADLMLGRGEYVISDRALMQVDAEFNFPPQRMAIDAVVDGA